MCLNIKIFLRNAWSQIKEILVIFTHLMLWVVVARHNFKWVKILNIQFSGLRVNIGPASHTVAKH